jgi:hypothetical protein
MRIRINDFSNAASQVRKIFDMRMVVLLDRFSSSHKRPFEQTVAYTRLDDNDQLTHLRIYPNNGENSSLLPRRCAKRFQT